MSKLSDDLKFWRAERPDEWTMDRFITQAIELEKRPEIICECLDPIQVVRGGLCCNCDGKLPEKP